MENVHRALKPKSGHFIKSRTTELVIGLVLFFAGALLLYDAFDARGKRIPWPGGAIAPW